MPLFSSVARLAVTLALAAGVGLATAQPPAGPTVAMPPPGSSAHGGPVCQFGACFDYVFGRQLADVDGATVRMAVEQPKLTVRPTADHSLQELSLQSTDRRSTIEVGWTVDQGLNGDALPHLFVFHWVDGKPTCYNGCGFVQASTGPKAGAPLTPHTSAEFAMRFVGDAWWVYHNQRAVGSFPASLWPGGFARAQVITAFGEVAHAENTTCEQMGDGEFGHGRAPSFIRDYALHGTTTAPKLVVADTSPKLYDEGAPTPTAFFLGGPGAGPCPSR